MNREQAIKWVRGTYQGHWPMGTKGPTPDGWRWVVAQLPYQQPTYKLINASHDEIIKEDVYK